VLPPASGELIARVTTLQDHLGALNDADIAARLAREHLMTHGPRLSAASQAAVSAYLGDREGMVLTLRRTLATRWRPVTLPVTRRMLAGVVASL